jgi:hypothetical protein
MKTSSAKAKGRKLQQKVRDALRQIGKRHGLVDGDIESRGMGQNGCDIILSPAALRVFNLAVECKQVEKLQVVPTFLEHLGKYAGDNSLKVLIHGKNRIEPLVTMRFEDFVALLEKGNRAKEEPQIRTEAA